MNKTNKKELTYSEAQSLAAKARWKGKSKKQRSRAMKQVRKGKPYSTT